MPTGMLGPAAATAFAIPAALLCGPQLGSGAAAGKGWPMKADGEFLVIEALPAAKTPPARKGAPKP